MNQEMLLTIDDESLDAVAGGARLPIRAITTSLFKGLFAVGDVLVSTASEVVGSVTKFVGEVISETTDL